MELILDTANVEKLKYYQKVIAMDGVTTNPTILSREKRGYNESINDIINLLNPEQTLHIQTISTTVEEIVNEGIIINNLRKNTFAKIPCTVEGLEAMKILKQGGYLVTATACYSISQGVMAAKAGVDYIAPYLNRLDNIGVNGVSIITDLVSILKIYDYKAKVVAASFKNVQQVIEMMKIGCPAMTISPEVIDHMLSNSLTKEAVHQFSKDWKSTFNKEHFEWNFE